MTTLDIAQQYVSLCKEGKYEECLDKLYAKDAASVEALSPPGGEIRVANGLDAIEARENRGGRPTPFTKRRWPDLIRTRIGSPCGSPTTSRTSRAATA